MNKGNQSGKKKTKNKERSKFSEFDDDETVQRNKRLNKTKRGNKNFED